MSVTKWNWSLFRDNEICRPSCQPFYFPLFRVKSPVFVEGGGGWWLQPHPSVQSAISLHYGEMDLRRTWCVPQAGHTMFPFLIVLLKLTGIRMYTHHFHCIGIQYLPFYLRSLMMIEIMLVNKPHTLLPLRLQYIRKCFTIINYLKQTNKTMMSHLWFLNSKDSGVYLICGR